MFLFFQDFQSLRKHHGLGETRKVTIKKGEDEGLGLSITVSVCLLSLSNIPVYRSREEYFVTFNTLVFMTLILIRPKRCQINRLNSLRKKIFMFWISSTAELGQMLIVLPY